MPGVVHMCDVLFYHVHYIGVIRDFSSSFFIIDTNTYHCFLSDAVNGCASPQQRRWEGSQELRERVDNGHRPESSPANEQLRGMNFPSTARFRHNDGYLAYHPWWGCYHLFLLAIRHPIKQPRTTTD